MRVSSPAAALIAAALAVPAGARADEAPDTRHIVQLGFDVGAPLLAEGHGGPFDAAETGLHVGVQAEVNALVHLRLDVAYREGRVFDPAWDRRVAVSAGLHTPRLGPAMLTLQEVYLRASTDPEERLVYALPGLGFEGDLKGTLGGSFGAAVLGTPVADGSGVAVGPYAGLEYVVRVPVARFASRATVFVGFQDGIAHPGLLLDADLTLAFKAGLVRLGPRLDVAYRHFALSPSAGGLFGRGQEVAGSLGLALTWGVGRAPDQIEL